MSQVWAIWPVDHSRKGTKGKGSRYGADSMRSPDLHMKGG